MAPEKCKAWPIDGGSTVLPALVGVRRQGTTLAPRLTSGLTPERRDASLHTCSCQWSVEHDDGPIRSAGENCRLLAEGAGMSRSYDCALSVAREDVDLRSSSLSRLHRPSNLFGPGPLQH